MQKTKLLTLFLLLCCFGVSSNAAIDVNNSFAPASIFPGQVSRLTIKIQNSQAVPATGVAFVNNLPAGLFIAGTGNLSNDGGGSFTVSNGGSFGTLVLSGATIPAGNGVNPGVLTLAVDVTTPTKGNYTNIFAANSVSGTTTIAETNPQPSSATLIAVVQSIVPSWDSFPNTFAQGFEQIPQSLRLTNTNPIPLTGVAVALDFRTAGGNLFVVPGSVTTTCGGAAIETAVAPTGPPFTNASILSLSGGTIPANGACQINLLLSSARSPNDPLWSATDFENIKAGTVTSIEGASNPADLIRNFESAGGLRIVKSFTPSTIYLASTSTARLQLFFEQQNTLPITGNLTDTLPTNGASGGQMTFQSVVSNTCGGTITGSGNDMVMTGLTVPAAPANIAGLQTNSCTLVVDVNVTPNSAGNYFNRIPVAGATGVLGTNNFGSTGATLIASANIFSVSKVFSQTSLRQGNTTDLTLTLTNNGPVGSPDVTNIRLAQDLFTNFCVAPYCDRPYWQVQSVVTNTCNGSLTATTGTNSYALNGASIPGGSACQITLKLLSSASAFPPNFNIIPSRIPVGNILYDYNGTANQVYPTAIAPLVEVRMSPAITVQKFFTPTTVGPNGISRLRININHIQSSGETNYAIQDIAMTDNLPPGMVVSPIANITNTCGGTVVALPGSNQISLSGGAIAAVASGVTGQCIIFVNVNAPPLIPPALIGSSTNTILATPHNTQTNFTGQRVGDPSIFGQVELFANSSATLNIQASSIQTNRSFTPSTINGGAPSRMKIAVSNTLISAVPLSNLGFAETLPSGIELYANPAFAWGDTTTGLPTAACSGTPVFTGTAGSQIWSMSGAAMSANANCAIFANVTSVIGGNHVATLPIGIVTTNEGITNDNASTATLTVGRQINIGKGFDRTVMATGEVATLTVFIYNTNDPGNDEGGINPAALTDTLPLGLKAVPGTQATTCAGGIASIGVGVAGRDTLVLSGGLFVSRATCTLSVQVTAAATGSYTNSIPSNALITLSNTSNPDPATATIVVIAKPTITKAFAPATTLPGQTSTITFTLTNPNSAALYPAGLSGVQFNDTLTGMVLATPASLGGTCTGVSYTGVAGSANFSVNSGLIAASASCTITIPVTAVSAGSYPNTTNGVSVAEIIASGNPSNTATLTVLAPVTAVKSFSSASASPGAPVTLTFTVTNPNTITVPIIGTALNDPLPTSGAGVMRVAAPLTVTNTCGVALQNASASPLTAGDTQILLAGGTIPVGGCLVSVAIEATAPGLFNNSYPSFTTTAGVAAGSSASLTVASLPQIILAKSCSNPPTCTTTPQVPGTDVTYSIAFTNTGGLNATDTIIVDPMPANLDFKLGSAISNPGTTGITFIIEYSADFTAGSPSTATWSYTPVSGGGGAAAGYDRSVKAIRWRTTDNLPFTAPNNNGNVSFIARIQ